MTCWESGFTWNPVSETERMRDYNLYAMFSAWDVLKNVDGQYPNHHHADKLVEIAKILDLENVVVTPFESAV